MSGDRAAFALFIGIVGVALLAYSSYELRLVRSELLSVSVRLDDLNRSVLGISVDNTTSEAMAGLRTACDDFATSITSKFDDAGTSLSAAIEVAAESVSEHMQSVRHQVSLVKQSVDKTRDAVNQVAEKAEQTNAALLILHSASDRVIEALNNNFKWLVDFLVKSVTYLGTAIDNVRVSMPRLPMYNN